MYNKFGYQNFSYHSFSYKFCKFLVYNKFSQYFLTYDTIFTTISSEYQGFSYFLYFINQILTLKTEKKCAHSVPEVSHSHTCTLRGTRSPRPLNLPPEAARGIARAGVVGVSTDPGVWGWTPQPPEACRRRRSRTIFRL